MLFIGGVFPSDKRQDIINNSKGPIQFAANTLQFNIIKGLEANLDQPVDMINAVFIGSYPKYYRRIVYRKNEIKNTSGVFRWDIGFVNIFMLKHLVRAIMLKKILFKWYKTNPADKRIVIYSMHWPFIYAVSKLKQKYNDCHITLVVPDLPEYMNLNGRKNAVLSLLKKIDTALIFDKLKYIDSYTLLTKFMKEKLKINNKPYTVVEGMCDPDEMYQNEVVALDPKQDNRIILYTGSLHKKYGVLVLLEAFSLIEHNNFELWICGDGDAKEDVIEATNCNSKIKYFGQVDREEVLKLQNQSTVLVNPRSGTEEYTKYSFPSKTIEYLVAGKPVIMDRLLGIPEEYDEYICFVDDYSAYGFSEKIAEICNKSDQEISAIGLKGRDFILNKKNYKVQCKKMIDMINNAYIS